MRQGGAYPHHTDRQTDKNRVRTLSLLTVTIYHPSAINESMRLAVQPGERPPSAPLPPAGDILKIYPIQP